MLACKRNFSVSCLRLKVELCWLTPAARIAVVSKNLEGLERVSCGLHVLDDIKGASYSGSQRCIRHFEYHILPVLGLWVNSLMGLDPQVETCVRFEIFSMMPLPRYNYCLRGDSTPYFPFTAPSFWVPSHDIMSQASVTARNDVLSIMTLISGQCSGSKKLSNHLTLLAFCDWPAVMGRPAHVPQLFEANAYARVALPLRPHLPPPPLFLAICLQ